MVKLRASLLILVFFGACPRASAVGVELLRRLPLAGRVNDLFPSEYGFGFLAWAGEIARFDLREDRALWIKDFGGGIPGIAVAPDGQHFTYCAQNAFLALFDLDSAAHRRDFTRPEFSSAPLCTAAAFSRDGRFLVTGDVTTDDWLTLWDVESGIALGSYQNVPTSLLQLGMAARDGFVYALGESALRIWDLDSTTEIRSVTLRDLLPHVRPVPPGEDLPQRHIGFKALAFGPDMRFVALSAGWSAHLVDLETGAVVRTFALASGAMIRRLGITSDGARLLAYGVEITNGHESPGTLAAWAISGEKLFEYTDRALGALFRYRPDAAAAFLGDGRYFVSGEVAFRGDDGIKVWRLPN